MMNTTLALIHEHAATRPGGGECASIDTQAGL